MPTHFLDWIDRADPRTVAVVDDAGAVTYGTLREEARRLARSLQEEFGSGRYLFTRADKSIAFVRRFLAISYSGNVPVPVDPAAPPSLIEEIGARCGTWALVDVGGSEASETVEPLDRRDSSLPAVLLFTSGTSGLPKGVPISQSNLAHAAKAISDYLHYHENPSAAVVLPLHYSYALLSQVLCMFLVGGTVRVFENFRNPLRFAREVDHLALRTFCGVPSTFHTLATLNRLTPITMSTVRVVCSAGGAMDRSLLPTIKAVFPNATFFDNYGMTEAAPRITFIRDDDPHFSRGSCGRPIDGVELRILDERTLQPLSEGEIGVVALRGPNVFAGYLNDEAATREAFTSDGFLLSGDLGCLKEGYLYLHGRRDEVFNVGGEKIGPLEIERVLADHELVRSSAVASMTDAGRGLVPVAYVELNGPIDRKSLVAFLRSRLPPTKIPWRFFEVKGYPMTPNGKVIRRRLAPDDANFVVREVI